MHLISGNHTSLDPPNPSNSSTIPNPILDKMDALQNLSPWPQPFHHSAAFFPDALHTSPPRNLPTASPVYRYFYISIIAKLVAPPPTGPSVTVTENIYTPHTSSNPPNNTQNSPSHSPATTQQLATALSPPSPRISNSSATTHPSHSPAQTLPIHNNRPHSKHFDTKCNPFHLTLNQNDRCQSPLSSRFHALIPSNSLSIPIMHTKVSRDKIIMHTSSKLNLDRLFKKFEAATKNTDIQILESLLCPRLTHFLETNSLLNPLQFGFRRGISTVDALFLLKGKIKKAIHDFQCCLLINLDITSAFDQLWIAALSHHLHALNLPPSLLNMYGSFLVNRSATLTYRGHSRSVSPSRGCAQGSKSGPILWNIFFDPILSLPFPQGVHIQAFADDIPTYAQTSLYLINTWCLDHKLNFSPSKSSILPIFCHNPSLHINFIPIPCLEEMTILGVKFDSPLSFSSHLNHICSKISNLFPRLHTCANAYYGLGFKARRLMYTAVFEPTLTYAAAIWEEILRQHHPQVPHDTNPYLHCTDEDAPPGSKNTPTFCHLLSTKTSTFQNLAPFLTSSLSLVPCFEASIPLSNHSSVLQAESFALLSALKDIFFSSTTSLCGNLLGLPFTSSIFARLTLSLSLIHRCQTTLYKFLDSHRVTLHWVKGHSGNFGDCRADASVSANTASPAQYKLASRRTLFNHLRKSFWDTWEEEFITANPKIYNNLGISPRSLSSSHKHIIPDCVITTGLVTGHTWIGSFDKTKNIRAPTCNHCLSSSENISHIFFECPNLITERSQLYTACLRTIGYIPLNLKNLFWEDKLWKFILRFAHVSGRFVPSNITASTST
ncbi:hypothetical protein LAZ67_20001342 [Cordylochernes scorpioides]|uniref:Reverse transcriptase domain-containing protein n=1 Tax=Cordylochernes scorpioides TaxID=51811 RepID=A0ABY6LKU1_9ARAC|nr:hypothetical protein LAZ67_20001342 [Cordylochernes scorpioides]